MFHFLRLPLSFLATDPIRFQMTTSANVPLTPTRLQKGVRSAVRLVIDGAVVIAAPLPLNLAAAEYSQDKMRSTRERGGRFHQVNGTFVLRYGCFKGGQVGGDPNISIILQPLCVQTQLLACLWS